MHALWRGRGPWRRAPRAAQVADLGAAVDRLNREKVKLEQQMEMEEEGIVNRLQRQIETLLAKYKARAPRRPARVRACADGAAFPS